MLTTHTEHVQLWACFFSTHSRVSSDESACVYHWESFPPPWSQSYVVSSPTNKKHMGLSENRLNPYTQWFSWSLSLLNGYFIGNINPIFRHTHMVSGDCCKWMGERIHFQMSKEWGKNCPFFSHARSSWRIARVLTGQSLGTSGLAKCSDGFGNPEIWVWIESVEHSFLNDLLYWKNIRETPENPVKIYTSIYI